MVEELLNVKEAAHACKVSVSRMYHLISQKEIRTTRIGRSVRIHPDDLNEFIRSKRSYNRNDIQLAVDAYCYRHPLKMLEN